MKTTQVPFDIFLPATETRAAVKVATIEIEIVTDASGNQRVTPESSTLIDKTQARYLGLLAGTDIRGLRERLQLSQDQLSDLLGCGKKSLSRWESGREFPSQLVNTLLRLLEEERVTLEDLRATRQPRAAVGGNVVHFIDSRREAPATYDLAAGWKRSPLDVTEPLAI